MEGRQTTAAVATGQARAVTDLKSWTERHPGHGLTIEVHRFADEAAKPRGAVLLLHGFMDAGGTWDLVAELLVTEGLDVWAPDFRGFGGSDWVSGGGYYHFANYLADLDAVTDATGADPLLLVGHSMGGTVASLYAGARPERVKRLALLEGLGPPAQGPELAVVRTRTWLDQLRKGSHNKPLTSLDDAVQRLAFAHPRIDESILRSRAPHLIRERDGQLGWAFDPVHRSTSPARFDVDGYRAFMAQIVCPVLFVSGGDHGWHPPDEAERLAALPSPPAQVVLEGAGHMMHWTQPEAVARVLAEFLLEA